MSMVADLASAANAGAPNAAVAAGAAAANGVAPAAAAAPVVSEPAVSRWSVPEEYKTQEAVRKFMDDKGTLDVGVLLKSHVNLESKLGRDKIVIPKSDDEYKEVYKALGCPDDPAKYEFKKPDNVPEGITPNESGEKFLRTWAQQNGLNQKQAAAAYDAFLKHTTEQTTEWTRIQKESRDKCEADLKREHGQAYGQFEGAAKAALAEYGDPDFFQYLDQQGLSNDPRLVRIFGRIGKELLGDGKLKGPNGGGGGAGSPAEIQGKIDTLMTERHKELFNNDHPDHKRYAGEYQALMKQKHGGK